MGQGLAHAQNMRSIKNCTVKRQQYLKADVYILMHCESAANLLK